ncbi:MAG TPA: molybdopterin-dependent oxidoreductase [Nitrospiria bacterium]|jgi:formate dehydrogenase alpha subunit
MAEQLINLGKKEMIECTIDGEKVMAEKGTSLYDVITSMGKILPAMCYHYTFKPFGSCGICLVGVEGKKMPVRSCTAPVKEPMVVTTGTPELFEAQKKAIEKHLTTHPLDCPVCDADGHCELQDMTFNFGIGSIGPVKQKGIPEDTRSIVLDFNMERCILCGQCINICKEVQMVDALRFMKKDGQTHVVAHGDVPLFCEFCGDCMTVCPVGAITDKYSKYKFKPWQLVKTQTTCNFCPDACQIILNIKEEKEVIQVDSPLSWTEKWGERESTKSGHGGICVRGRYGFRYITSPERLQVPLIKTNNQLEETSWWDATEMVSKRLSEIKAVYGGKSIAGLISARCTNEDLYLFQKFMRVALGSNRIDSSARYGHMNAVRALSPIAQFGTQGLSYEEITKAQTILVIGSDLTETNPIIGLRVKEALRRYKAQVVVVHPMKTNLAELASHHLPIKPGSEGWFIRGLVKILIEENLGDSSVAGKSDGPVSKLRDAVQSISLEQVVEHTGIPRETLLEVAKLYLETESAVLFVGEGILKTHRGFENMKVLMDLAILAGKLDRDGCGIIPLCEENNEQGAVDMGATSEFLPGQVPYGDVNLRDKVEQSWGEILPTHSGSHLMGIIEKARQGEIKALYLVGENPLGTLPASVNVKEALEKVEFIIVQDPFLTETGQLAHVVLPACTYIEKTGTFTGMTGMVLPVKQAMDPVGESRADWQIFSELSGAMGYPMEYLESDEIQKEIEGLVPQYYEGHSKKNRRSLSSYLSGAFHEGIMERYQLVPSTPPGSYPYHLVMGQILYHSGKLSTRDKGLMEIYPKNFLRINPADSERLQLGDGARVRMDSENGSVELVVEVDAMLPEGLLFYPEHFNDPPVKDLFACEVDALTGVPYFKSARVSLTKTADAPPKSQPEESVAAVAPDPQEDKGGEKA